MSDYGAAFYLWGAKTLGFKTDKVRRLYPGDFKPKKPDTFMSLFLYWQELKEYYNFGGMFTQLTLQFEVMLWCQIYTRNESQHLNPWFKDGVRYCYDNIFADLYLQGGDETRIKGPLQFFDLFTWGGFMTALTMSLVREFAEELVWNFWVVMYLYIYMYAVNVDTTNVWKSKLVTNGICKQDDLYLNLFGYNISFCVFNV